MIPLYIEWDLVCHIGFTIIYGKTAREELCEVEFQSITYLDVAPLGYIAYA